MANVVNHEKQREGREDALDVLLTLVGGDLKRVNEIIVERMHSPIALIPQLAGHIIAAGGKRLRPLLTLASARLCGYEGERHAQLAACVEFIHTATLLHDDVVDESLLRRGRDSANALWGNKASVLVGDFLFSRSFELMVEDGALKVLGILSHASRVIAEGEVAQLITANDMATTEAQYLEVIRGKTAQLFAAACRIGAVVTERPLAEEEALDTYGMTLGIAFQLVDDYLDYSARQQDLGKTVGDDFMDGKITLPVILAYQRGTDDERAFWRRCMEAQDMPEPEADLAKAIELMTRYGTLAETVERARHYGERARSALDIFADGPAKAALAGIVDFCIERAR
ncbi:farnesyltranstransferase [Rhodospirillum rubrum]|uniref:polyprenyl synthetase family protein n=1 Tax=Rhodospirillum rubrum TaxID=1085 RepID=UPI001906478C|nr:polyprenyl synthetase family protein [Rhodospirillum rubrum]MBK1664494.1 farnesyltranstransferase [Rhodospirillum rubrum]MBK1676249.1 farnesyltranstransferase [Rhodospirillum rubrum]